MGIYTTNHIIMAYYISKLYKIKFISNIIGDEFSNSRKIKKHIKYVLASDCIIVRGNASKNFFSSFGYPEKKIFVVPNYFDFNSLTINNVHNIDWDLIYTGNFTEIKRLEILVNAVNTVKVNFGYSDIKVAIIGDGILRKKIIKKITDLRLNSNIYVFPYTNNINEYYYKSKVFIMTSEFEGLPMSMIEALGCGIPVIMPNISNIPEYAIDGYNALLVEPLNVEGFADAIYKLMTDEVLYKKLKAGAEKFREEHEYEFSLENISNIWNNIFSQLCCSNLCCENINLKN